MVSLFLEFVEGFFILELLSFLVSFSILWFSFGFFALVLGELKFDFSFVLFCYFAVLIYPLLILRCVLFFLFVLGIT